MASTFSQNMHLEEPATGDYVNTWSTPANANYNVIDSRSGNTVTIPLTSTNVTLTATNLQNFRFLLTGLLTGNVSLIWPAPAGGLFVVDNQTTGAFTVTLITNAGGSAGITAPQGQRVLASVDSVNVKNAADGTIPAGSLTAFGGSAVPAGWLLCDGSSYSTSTYPTLYAAIGTNYGTSGGGSFNVPDYRGRSVTGADNMGTGAAGRLTGASMSATGVGGSGGSESITLSLSQTPSHNHGGATGNENQNFQMNGVGVSINGSTVNIGGGSGNNVLTNGSSLNLGLSGFQFQDHNHNIPSAGGGGSHLNVQPTLLALVIIKY